MKTIQEQIAVMQHFADGGKVEMQYADGTWKLNDAPQWNWCDRDYRIAEEVDPYAELKKVAADPTKQVKIKRWSNWVDSGYPWSWNLHPEQYEIRDKPKPMNKVKLLAWFRPHDGFITWRAEDRTMIPTYWKRVPSEDKEIEVEND